MAKKIDTIIIGGGQAGLATSYHLKLRNREHVILEQATRPGNAWRNDRWDSFSLLTPNWSFRLPGAVYDGPARDGFMPRHEVISRFEGYIARYRLPVQYNMQVTSVETCPDGDGYRVKTQSGEWEAKTWSWLPAFSKSLKFPPSPPACRLRSSSCTPDIIVIRQRCRPAQCWWSAARSPAARSLRSCI